MNRFERVIEILDTAVGGASEPVGGPHKAFWRGKTRDQFILLKPVNHLIVTLGHGADSNLVQALRGQGDFGTDTGNDDALFRRMPAGRPAVSDADIAFIEQWIDDNCPEDELPGAQIGGVELALSGAASGDALLVVGPSGTPITSTLTLRTTDGSSGAVTVRPAAPNAASIVVTPSTVNLSGTEARVQVQASVASTNRNDVAIEIVQGEMVVGRLELTAIENPTLRFAGRFQVRLATDPDPFDHPFGINSSFGSFAVAGPDPAHPDEPPFDRIVRLQDAPYLRPFCDPIGVSVTEIEATVGGIPTRFSTGDPLIGQAVRLGPESWFDSENDAFAPAGFEPITNFQFSIGTAFVGKSVPSVPRPDPSQPPGSTAPTADGVFNLDDVINLPPGQTPWKPADFGLPEQTWRLHAQAVTTAKLASLNTQVTDPGSPAERIRQRRIQEHQQNLGGIRAPFRLLEHYRGLIDQEVTIGLDPSGVLAFLATLPAIEFTGDFFNYDSDCHTGTVAGTLSAPPPPTPPAPADIEAPAEHGHPVPRSPEAFQDESN